MLQDHFDHNDFAYGFGDFVTLKNGQHGMVVNVSETETGFCYDVSLWGTHKVIQGIPQDELEIDESELVEERG